MLQLFTAECVNWLHVSLLHIANSAILICNLKSWLNFFPRRPAKEVPRWAAFIIHPASWFLWCCGIIGPATCLSTSFLWSRRYWTATCISLIISVWSLVNQRVRVSLSPSVTSVISSVDANILLSLLLQQLGPNKASLPVCHLHQRTSRIGCRCRGPRSNPENPAPSSGARNGHTTVSINIWSNRENGSKIICCCLLKIKLKHGIIFLY